MTNDTYADTPVQEEQRAQMKLALGAMLIPVFFVIGFAVCIIGTYHKPHPNGIKLGVVGPAALTAPLRAGLQKAAGSAFDIRPVATVAEAAHDVHQLDLNAAFVPTPNPTQPATVIVASANGRIVATAAETLPRDVTAARGAQLLVREVRPLASGDELGLGVFMFMIVCTICGYLAVSLLYTAAPVLSPGRLYPLIVANAILVPTLAYLIGGLGFGTYTGSFGTILALIGVGALYTFVIGLITRWFQVLLGPPALFVSLAIFVFLNIPSLGATYTSPVLPAFWRFLNHFWNRSIDGQRRAQHPLLRRARRRHRAAQTPRLDGRGRRTPRRADLSETHTPTRTPGRRRRVHAGCGASPVNARDGPDRRLRGLSARRSALPAAGAADAGAVVRRAHPAGGVRDLVSGDRARGAGALCVHLGAARAHRGGRPLSRRRARQQWFRPPLRGHGLHRHRLVPGHRGPMPRAAQPRRAGRGALPRGDRAAGPPPSSPPSSRVPISSTANGSVARTAGWTRASSSAPPTSCSSRSVWKRSQKRARDELHATGRTVRKRTLETRDDLTAQERQVALMARGGLSNLDIAARLFLSPRTVAWHLRKVFTKLGIRSRRELTNALAGADFPLSRA